MTAQDAARWNRRYREQDPPTADDVGLPARFRPFFDLFPTRGHAVELACGTGTASVWLAQRGLQVWACDASEEAIAQARGLAENCGQASRCRFEVVDLDNGLPAGDAAEVLLCNKFRDPLLDGPIIERLAVGGLLAVSALSEVGASSGRFRAAPGELTAAFGALETIAHGEELGEAWLLARRR